MRSKLAGLFCLTCFSFVLLVTTRSFAGFPELNSKQPLLVMDGHQVVQYFNPNRPGFNFPNFAIQQGFQIPDGFWEFWRNYYSTPLSHRNTFTTDPRYADFTDLFNQIVLRAQAQNQAQANGYCSIL